MKNDNEIILARMRGVPAQSGPSNDPCNPNSGVGEMKELERLQEIERQAIAEGCNIGSTPDCPVWLVNQRAEQLKMALRPIGMQEVRLIAGEGKIASEFVLEAVNIILKQRLRHVCGND